MVGLVKRTVRALVISAILLDVSQVVTLIAKVSLSMFSGCLLEGFHEGEGV